jgi:DNA replication factor GINS
MNIDELQSAQSRERQTDSLQQLRDSFYENAGRFIQQLREEREHVAANADDPFDSSDVQRLTDEINTAEQTVEAIYERRIGKLVKQASLEAAGMAADVEGLTTEEQEAFDNLVSTIEENRTRVLDEVLANDRNDDSTTETKTETQTETEPRKRTDDDPPRNESEQSGPTSETTELAHEPSTEESPPSELQADSIEATDSPSSTDSIESSPSADDTAPSVSAADMMGDGGEALAQESNRPTPPDVSLEAGSQDVPVHERPDASSEQSDVLDTDSTDTDDDRNGVDSHGDYPQVDRSVVRITRDVGKILCIDQREYDLSEDDVVTLPETNVEPLLEHDAAVQLD